VISARHAWWYFLCHRKGFSKEKIAEAARRDRRAVYYGLRHAQNMLDTGDAFFARYRDFLLKECAENNS
jgi:hypothetical protein